MNPIQVLDAETIDRIAAGEVVERPSSVVKELVENAIDAGADSITVEIKDGGISFIRVTDNGSGIPREQLRTAFLRHATSKIRGAEDLTVIASLGFRGEALSSICAVAMVEVITKTADALTGTHLVMEGPRETVFEEVGAPTGTTFLIRNLFFNTPARRKFLKSPTTEAGYIIDLMEHMALSRPDISFKFQVGSQTRFYTSGNGELREVIYRIYGRDMIQNLVPISLETEVLQIDGYLGTPAIVRSNRNFEIYFLGGRYIRSNLLGRAIEEGYREYLMQHKFPLCVLHLTLNDLSKVDVNVHPSKMEVRFMDGPGIFEAVSAGIRERLRSREMIPSVGLDGKQSSDREMQLLQEMSRQGKPVWGGGRGQSGSAFKGNGGVQSGSVSMGNGGGQSGPVFMGNGRGQSGPVSRGNGEVQLGPVSRGNGGGQSGPAFMGNGGVQSDSVSMESDGGTPVPARQESDKELHRMASALSDRSEQGVGSGNSAAEEQDTVPRNFAASPQEEVLQQSQSGREGTELSPDVKKEKPQSAPEPFETNRARQYRVMEETRYQADCDRAQDFHQGELFEEKVLTPEKRVYFKLIGQVFDTYWLIEYEDRMLVVDQHAAHEKVKYERFMKQYHEKSLVTQNLLPPVIVSLTGQEETAYRQYASVFEEMGFEVEPFGGSEYALRSVPVDLYGCQEKELFLAVLDELLEGGIRGDLTVVREKIASMSCKAAVKGNNRLSTQEAQQLIDELLTLDNPYNCPHGRPTIISMSKYEMEKKFKR